MAAYGPMAYYSSPSHGGIWASLYGTSYHINYETFRHAFSSKSLAYSASGRFSVDNHIRESPLVYSRQIRADHMERAWRLILVNLSTASGPCDGLTLDVTRMLETELQRDVRHELVNQRDISAFPQCLALFMCLADISLTTKSKLIGHGLCSFWNGHGSMIVGQDHDCLAQWAKALVQAKMDGSLKLTALRTFLDADHTALTQMRYDSPNTVRVLDTLHNISAYELEHSDTLISGYNGSSSNRFLRPPMTRPVSYFDHRARSVSPMSDILMNEQYTHQQPMLYPTARFYDRPATRGDILQTQHLLSYTNHRLADIEHDVANVASATFGCPIFRGGRPSLPRSRSAGLFPSRALGPASGDYEF